MVRRVRCRASGDGLYLLASGPGGAFLISRAEDGTWSPWQRIATAAGDDRGDALAEIAVVDGALHVVGATAEGLWHTVRHPDGRWDPLADLARVVPALAGPIRTVHLATITP